ncbi:hypothetical protein PoB_003485100 [Plakobranchus ocellatus]|uniref:Condensin complex subunit 1 n=1 Tax=Plakobranchus ocellatus TaxID=259542 RepID=A0AAV4AJ41_9GAST|nr:hypothetical protein PoB_003485100 [Plakobranchus ocellatus]
MTVQFVIPSSRDDLLSNSGETYCVEEILTVRQVSPALQALKAASRGNSDCIVQHFDSLFSVLCIQKDLDAGLKDEAWHYLLRGSQTFLNRLTSDLDQSDLAREDRLNSLNATKMVSYLLCQFLEMFDGEATRPLTVATGKGRGKKSKASSSSTDMDWDYERHEGVQLLLKFIQLSLNKLWDPPVAEEEFVSLISSCCYKLLENPSTSKNKETLVSIAHILGNLIKRYNHGLGASLKLDQLLKHFEFLTSPLVQVVEIVVMEYGCKSLLTDIIREIGNVDAKEAARDAAVGKAYAGFLVEIAEKMPKMVMPNMSLIVGHLESESYTLRNGILGMMGEILIKYICKEELDDKLRATRDGFFEKLEDHVHDVNAFVRSKVLQIWLTIVNEKCLPLLRQEVLMALVVGRLNDKSSIVRRHALQLVTALLKSNPFAAQLTVEDLRSNYEKEKAQLEEMCPPVTPPAASQQDDKLGEWDTPEAGLTKALDTWSGRDSDASALIGDEEPWQQVLEKIIKYLENQEFPEALALTSAAMECYPDCPVFLAHKSLGESEDQTEENEEVEQPSVKLGPVLKDVFLYVKQPPLPTEPDAPDSMPDSQFSSEITKQQTLVQYLKNSLTFALQVQECIPVICQLLGSKNTTDILEAIAFFVTAVEFGVASATVGVRKMLVLVWSQEQAVKEAVAAAYRQLYLLPKDKNAKTVAASIVKNLSALLVGCTFGDLSSLETLVCEFVKSGDIGSQVIQALWERFTLKSSSVTPQDARAAVMLLSMCAKAQPNIVKSNVEVLVQEGLGARAESDYLLVQGTCQALLKLSEAPKEKGKPPPEPYRLPQEHDLFSNLTAILVKGVNDSSKSLWIPLADLAVTVVYRLCDSPDQVCANLLRQLVQALVDVCDSVTQEAGDSDDDKSNSVSYVLARVLSVAGQVAFRQTVFMEEDILTEIKRRQTVAEENKKAGAVSKANSSRRKSKGGGPANSRTESEIEEDMALAGGASADDAEAEFVKKICETEILNGQGLLSDFCPLLIAVCSNSSKFPDPELQTAASMALARFMIVSSTFCEAQLQLLFTLLERAQSPVIRSNLIIALGDLTFRFPNLVEPWTAHLYARLLDLSPLVRKTTLQVLTHLILNDMVKVKGQISELATCIVDPDERIAGLAKLFFHELSKKSNSMYNMPDIISRLSDPEIGVEEKHFHTIIKFIFSHIEKSKHCESLTEKLCHRFRAARTDRQVRDLAFCLSQLTYSERGLSKLLENFPCYADKLVDNDVYAHFSQILTKSRQFIRPDSKTTVDELESKLEQAHTKGMEEDEVAQKAATKSSVTGAAAKTKGKLAKGKTPSKKNKRTKKSFDDDSDNGNESAENEDPELDMESPIKPKRDVRGRNKSGKPRFTLDSDDENDQDLFNVGSEGQIERDLDDEDTLTIKPSRRRSRFGKVKLTTPLSGMNT